MTQRISADEAGKVWKVKAASGLLTIASGATGQLVEITAPAGQLVRLHTLSTTGVNPQGGISIQSDEVDSLSTSTIANNVTSSGFYLSRSIGGTSVAQGAALVSEIIGRVIAITKNAGNTTEELNYAYEFGVFE
jgi:hypothetical protein